MTSGSESHKLAITVTAGRKSATASGRPAPRVLLSSRSAYTRRLRGGAAFLQDMFIT